MISNSDSLLGSFENGGATMASTSSKKETEMKEDLSLDILAEKNVAELDDIYRHGTMPKKYSALDGTPKGRMLAVRLVDKGPLFSGIKRFAENDRFPWDGKSFHSVTDTEGTGINRVHVLGQHNLFPFQTRTESSVIDGKDCIYLDYDLPENPWAIRKVRDELREVSPGLFLGPAMWKDNKGGATFLLWFALDNTVKA